MTLMSIARRSLSNGIAGAVTLSIAAGDQTRFIVSDTSYPVYVVGAGLGVAAAAVSELVTMYILPHIPGNQKLVHLESIVLHVGGTGAVFALVPRLVNGNFNMNESKKFFAAGVATEVISSYVNDVIMAVDESDLLF